MAFLHILRGDGDPGVSTIVLIRPDDGIGVAAFANGDTDVPGKLVNRLIKTPPDVT